MIRFDVPETVGEYLSALIRAELTNFLGREPYERVAGKNNQRNGSYTRRFALKGIGNVKVHVLRDRKGKFTTGVIPRSKQYEEEISQELNLMCLWLIGRDISPTEISHANVEFAGTVEKS
jgi:transposase-like protein